MFTPPSLHGDRRSSAPAAKGEGGDISPPKDTAPARGANAHWFLTLGVSENEYQGGDTVNGVFEIALVVVLVGYLIFKRLAGQPAQGKRMLLLPIIYAVVGVGQSWQVFTSPTAIEFLGLTAIVSVGMGLIRGASVRVYEANGLVHMRYTAVTVALWVVTFAAKFGIGYLLGTLDATAEHAVTTGPMLTLGVSMLAEGIIVLAKALRVPGQIIWARGKDGAEHRASPFLDNMKQQRLEQHGGMPGEAGTIGEMR